MKIQIVLKMRSHIALSSTRISIATIYVSMIADIFFTFLSNPIAHHENVPRSLATNGTVSSNANDKFLLILAGKHSKILLLFRKDLQVFIVCYNLFIINAGTFLPASNISLVCGSTKSALALLILNKRLLI